MNILTTNETLTYPQPAPSKYLTVYTNASTTYPCSPQYTTRAHNSSLQPTPLSILCTTSQKNINHNTDKNHHINVLPYKKHYTLHFQSTNPMLLVCSLCPSHSKLIRQSLGHNSISANTNLYHTPQPNTRYPTSSTSPPSFPHSLLI